MRKYFVVVFLLYSVLMSAQPRFAPERPKLVIGILVDGMRYDYIRRYWDKFGEKGFKRLIYNGTICQNYVNKQLLNENIVSAATISTGAYASSHGIIDKDWYNRITESVETAFFDTKQKGITSNGDIEKYNAKKMLASTLSDELSYSESGKAKVVSIALDPNVACALAGHNSQAFWLNTQTGDWTSSGYYLDSLPAYVQQFNAKKLADIYLQKEWTTFFPLDKYTESLPDKNPYERAFGRFTKEMPYNLQKLGNSVEPYKILRETPFGNSYTKDFALSLILDAELGKDDVPDLLQIAFTAGEGIFNRFHPLSVENEDYYIRLDADIAHFLEFIDNELGKENVLVYFTSTHGMALPPDYQVEQNFDVDYFAASKKLGILKSYLKAVYGKGNWISYYNHQQIYLNRDLIRQAEIPLSEFQHTCTDFLVQIAGISQAYSSTNLENNSASEGKICFAKNSYNQKRGADIYILLSPGWCETPYFRDEQRMYSPNSVYSYDTHLPLIWYGWKMKRRTLNLRIEPVDIAPTVANFIQISWPNSVQGKAINDWLAGEK